MRLISTSLLRKGYTQAGWLQDLIALFKDKLYTAFFPMVEDVTPDYWQWLRWRMSQRFFSSTMHNFATQSLLIAAGIGAQRAMSASAMINWILKDGVNRIARMIAGTRFAKSFDSDLKRFRFTTSLMFTACMGCEFLTVQFPQHFLLLASVANVGKAVGLTTYVSTNPAFQKSLCRGENLADLTAKTQAQHMVVDTLALGVSAWLTHVVRHNPSWQLLLPLLAYPVCAVGDVLSIYMELKAIQLRTVNRERAELIAEVWINTQSIPSFGEVSANERLMWASDVAGGFLPLRLQPLELVVDSADQLLALLRRYRGRQHVMALRTHRMRAWNLMGPRVQLAATLSERASPEEMFIVVLEAAMLRQRLRQRLTPLIPPGTKGKGVVPALHTCLSSGAVPIQEMDALRAQCRDDAVAAVRGFMGAVGAAGWRTDEFLLSSREKLRYCLAPAATACEVGGSNGAWPGSDRRPPGSTGGVSGSPAPASAPAA